MFRNCKTLDELKSLFRKLAMRLHPDYGGSNELMILCKNSYDESIEIIKELDKTRKDCKTSKKSAKFYEKTFEDVEEGDTRLKIIDEIKKYSKNHPNFKMNFTNSIIDYLEENGHISSSQYNSLLRIYYSFKMDKEKTQS